MKCVVTYFEPFGGRETNASKEIALSIVGKYDKVSLPVSWDKVPPIIESILQDHPRYLFMLGEAKDYPDVTIEMFAYNSCSGTDEDGQNKDKAPISIGAPKMLKSNLNLDGLTFTTSTDAGRYLCNYSYYLALLKTEVTKIVFIHIPYLSDKGLMNKEAALDKVMDIIHTLMHNDDGFIMKLNGKFVNIDESNAKELYPKMQIEYNYPNVIIGQSELEDGQIAITGRADGYKGVWYVIPDKDKDRDLCIRELYHRIAYFQSGLSKSERENSLYLEKTYRFSNDEYIGGEGKIKRFMNLFICRADYKDEIAFYRSIDRVYEALETSVVDKEEIINLDAAKSYVSRLGLEKCKKILINAVR